MKIMYVTSECAPFVKTGGLGDVAGSLPKALAAKGHDVRVFCPLYSAIGQEWREKFYYLKNAYVRLGWRNQYCGIFRYESDVYKRQRPHPDAGRFDCPGSDPAQYFLNRFGVICPFSRQKQTNHVETKQNSHQKSLVIV